MFEKVDLEVIPRNKVFKGMGVGDIREITGYTPASFRAMLRARMKKFVDEAYSFDSTSTPMSFRRDA
jgi:hypothetical protein